MSIIRKSIATLFILVALLIPLFLPASLPLASAQETTEEPAQPTTVVTEIATDAPTEIPPTEASPVVTEGSPTTEAPTPEPEQAETEPSPEVTDTVEETEEAVEETTPEAPIEQTEEVSEPITFYFDDFSTFNSDKWNLIGWSVSDGTLRTSQTASSATLIGFEPVNFELNAQVLIPENNVLVIAFRGGNNSYRAMLSSNGSTRLYRDDALLDAYAASTPGGTWIDVAIQVANDTIAISTNGIAGIVYTDTPSLTDGRIDFLTDGAVSAEIQVDNLSVSVIDPVTAVFPTEYVAEAPATAQPETTVEPEVTPETTVEPEITPEATVDPEVTPEVTEEPGLSGLIYDKSPSSLHEILDIIQNSGEEYSEARTLILVRYAGYILDNQNRVGLKIHPAENRTSAQLELLVRQLGGQAHVVAVQSVTASLPLSSIIPLLENPSVDFVEQPDVVFSTGNSPSPDAAPETATYTEGFDMLGLTDWHNAGYTGTGVRVGILDTGFTSFVAGDPEYACLAGPIESSFYNTHGMAMIELICDIAPDASVYTYEVALSGYESLANAVYEAMADDIDVLVIAVDMMQGAPGDGTGQQDGDDPYFALQQARNQGMVIFAAAGNYGESYTDDGTPFTADGRAERFATINIPVTAADTDVAQFTIRASAGDNIVLNWNDWFDDPLGASDPANVENFRISVELDPAGRYDADLEDADPDNDHEADNYYADAFNDVQQASRPFIFRNPSLRYELRPTYDDFGPGQPGVVRRGCPILEPNIVAAGAYDGECTVIVTITRVSGDSAVTMQVGVIPNESFDGFDPIDTTDAQGNPIQLEEIQSENITILDFDGLGQSTLVGSHQGTIARPADSPDVIAVGAVCANEEANYAISPGSSQGPIFSAGGAPNGLTEPGSIADMKPEIMSVSYVTTSLNDADASECDGSVSGATDSNGFGGTSAAAAHAAAMTAVLLSNNTYSTMLETNGVQAIEDYILAHTTELPLGTAGDSELDGIDFQYGAGFFILGSPAYNPVNTQNLTGLPDLNSIGGACDADYDGAGDGDSDGIGDGTYVYVGQANTASTQDGSITNPYLNIGAAIRNATGTTCIVVMPGEYVTPIVLDSSNIHIFSYNSVTGTDYPESILYVSGQYLAGTGIQLVDSIIFNRNAGIYFDGATNSSVNGFAFVHSNTEDGLPRQAVFFDGATNSTLFNNQIGTFTFDSVNYTGWTNGDETLVTVYDSDSITVLENEFYGNTIGVSANNRLDTVISVLNSGAFATPVDVVRNRIQSNTAITQRQAAGSNYWATLLYSGNSYTNVVGNEFVQNTASTILSSRTPDLGNEEFNVISNVFLNNTTDVSLNVGDTNILAGALVQLYHTPQFIFANNTVVENDFDESGENGAMIGLGTPRQVSGPTDFDTSLVGSVASFAFVNNLVFNNTWNNLGAGLVTTTSPQAISDCQSLTGVADEAAQYNWWYDYDGTFDQFDACYFDFTDGFNFNLAYTANDPESDFVGNLPGSTLDPLTDPAFYALIEEAEGIYSRGIDYSSITSIDNDVNVIDLTDPTLSYGLDTNGEVRETDVIPWEGFTDGDNNPSVYTMDVGAFEFRELTIAVDDFSYEFYPELDSFLEDEPFIVINLDDRVSGGVGEITFDVVTPPAVYGTQCGPEYTDANNGIFFGTGANASRVFYCPPADFYTADDDDDPNPPNNVPIDNLTFTYTATDTGGQSGGETVTFYINEVHETISLDDIPALNYTFIGNLGQEVRDLRVRPFVEFSPNFAYSERGNAQFTMNGVTAVDYPFSYSGLNTTLDDPGRDIFAVAPFFNGDFIDFDLNDVEGVATISYTVTDDQGGQLTVNITVNNVSRLPIEPGIYDDSSFAWDYTGNWVAVSDSTAINNTLHTVRELNATAGFGIRGSGFTLYMEGTRLGGIWDLQIDINADGNYQSVTGWQLANTVDPASSAIYYATVEEGSSVFICTTNSINTLAPMSLTSNGLSDYIVKCDGYTYPGGGYDPGEETGLAEGVHLVNIVNTSGLTIGVDAFAIVDGDAGVGNELPLQPGFHDVEDLVLRDAFGTAWQEIVFRTFTNGFAYQLQGPIAAPAASNTVSFLVNGGTGFAIGTTFEVSRPEYTICVTDLSDNDMTCQAHDYTLTLQRTSSVSGVYRPFYGLDPDGTYRVDILPTSVATGSRFVLDSVVVFAPSDTTSETASGVVDDTDLDKLLYGDFAANGWSLNSRVANASNGTTTSVSRLTRTPGPYVAFDVDYTVDTIYWTFDTRTATRQAMICVDRADGVDTNSSPADGLLDNLADVDTAHGNCIVVNLTTGEYILIGADGYDGDADADGIGTPEAANLLLTNNTIVISEDLFRDENTDANENWAADEGALDPENLPTHTIEIFSLFDATLSVDTISAIGSQDLLIAGRYEEYTSNIGYFEDAGGGALTPTVPETSESSVVNTYTGVFTQVLGRTVRDFGAGVMFTNDVGAAIGFEFHGTGFAPAFRLTRNAEAVEVCWKANASGAALVDRVEDARDTGDCATFDNENRVITYNGLRPILGLTEDDYTVAITFLGDNFLPVANRVAEPEMWFDGVVIYDDDLTTLTPMTNGMTYDANYLRRNESNTFAYFGSNWATIEGRAGIRYNNSDVDNILRGETGATIAFRVAGANVITLQNPLGRANAPLLVCATDVSGRYCQTVSMNGVGLDGLFSIYLDEDGAIGNYTVTITTLDGGRHYIDAVTPFAITTSLTEGTYDNSDPNIVFDYGSENLLLNGGMERDLDGFWTANNAGTTIDQYSRRYSGLRAMRVVDGATPDLPSASSPIASLEADTTYTVIGYVQVDRITGGEVTITVDNLTDGQAMPLPITTDVTRNGTYEPFRFDITPTAPIDIQLIFEGTEGTTFYVDDVQVIGGSQWEAASYRLAYGGYFATSTAHGSQFSFSFAGTGFVLGMPTLNTGGEVEVCYDDNPGLSSPECITYENESLRPNYTNLRVIEGLPVGTYYVRVRDVEDGNSAATASRYPIPRISLRSIGVMTLDYISILNTSVPEITESGMYETTDGDGSGATFMTTVPAESWSTITGRLAVRYSDSSYTTVVQSNGVQNRFASGPAALFNLDLSTHASARILLDVNTANRLASKQLLACIGGPDGEIVRQPYDVLLRNSDDFDLENSDNCVLIETLPTSSIITLTPDMLPGLTSTGSDVILTVQTLTGGAFLIDRYQILYGSELTPGFYEEAIGNDLLGLTGTWANTDNRLYSGGAALVATEADGGDGASMSFNFVGTGISIVTSFGPRNGEIEVDLVNTGNGSSICTDAPPGAGSIDTSGDPNVETGNPVTAYGASISYAGLPCDEYTVTITAHLDTLESVAIDAFQIYDEVQSLGSLYDDAQVDTNGNALITYGPGEEAWSFSEGRFALTALNQTLHSTSSYGSVASFEIGETLPSDGIIIYYDTRTTRAPSVRVCFRDVATGALAGACVDQALDQSGQVRVSPTTPTGAQHYYVSIQQTDLRLKFALDAIQVLEDGLYEGIYDGETLNDDPTDDVTTTGTYNTALKAIDLAPGQTLTFTMQGIAFSLEVSQLSTIRDYNICVTDSAACDLVDDDGQTAAGNSALTYAGFHGDNGAERSLDVTLTNNGNSTLRITALHVLGANDELLINGTDRVENDAPQVRYLPFGSHTISALPRNLQSGGSEHVTRVIGASVYFEIQTDTPDDAGFEIGRQVSLANGSAEVCYGEIDSAAGGGVTTQSIEDARDGGQCTTVDHGTGNAYQVGATIATAADCADRCWVLINSLETRNAPFDFVRLYDAGKPMTAGRYQESFTGLNFEDDTGGNWDADPIASRFASGGFVRMATQDPAITTDNGPVMWFVIDGSGFAVNFVNDRNSDAIEICYAPGEETTFGAVTTNVLDAGICQVFENESNVTASEAARTIVGLPDGVYTVAVRMLPDNNTPRAHLPTLPITMQIDSVDVFDTDITSLAILNNDQVYETSYDNRDSNNNFAYFGDSWISYEGARARLNSGMNYDQAREYGAGILFRVQNADGLTFYTNLSAANAPIRVCVLPITADGLALGDTSLAECFDASLAGRGSGQALSFRFRDFLETSASDYMVSVVSMNDRFFPVDAIEVTNTDGYLTEGRYEATDVNLYYDGQSIDYVVNGSMEVDANWVEVVQPEVIYTPLARYAGRSGYSVNGNRGSGIESEPFDLNGATPGAPITYTAIAKVKVVNGSARLELVEGSSPISIQEFSDVGEAIAEEDPLNWQTLRVDFTLEGDVSNLRLQVVSNSFDSTFYIDEVHLYEGGEWTSGTSALYSNAHAAISNTPGSSMSFKFSGTGFEIGTAFDRYSGEVEICYDDDPIIDQVVEVDEPVNCFIYQNEASRTAYNVSRSVTGLTQDEYYVRVRDADDGYTVTVPRLGAARNPSPAFAVGKLTIDWVTIYNDTTVPTVDSGFFNEDATDETGEEYLRLYPEDGWTTIEGRLARNYSNESYYVATDRRLNNGRAGSFVAGSTAMLSVNVPTDGATVVLYTGTTTNRNSTLVLICAGQEVTGEIIRVETLVGVRTVLEYALQSDSTPGDCVVRNGRDGSALTVGPDDLAALSEFGENVPVSFTPLEPGQFIVDGFQVIQGNVLTPGVYDEFLPDTLLDFNSSGSNVPSDDTSLRCDDNTLWCPRKSTRAFGGAQLITQEAGATLEFDIEGTGFSVLTEVSTLGAEMRICYTQTPINGEASFPSRADTMSGGEFSWDNYNQNLTLGGVWCDLRTTNTNRLLWPEIQPDRINPTRGNQYGFSYYGLPMGNYSVQVMMFEEIVGAARNAVAIDAIAVFGDYTELPVMGTASSDDEAPSDPDVVVLAEGFYDDSEAALSLEPAIAWTETTSRFGPPSGPFNLTETTTTSAGAIAQMRVDGNSVILYQTFFIRNTADARVCVIVSSAVIHCTPEASTSAVGVEVESTPGNDAPWALAVETANFSQQNRRRSYFAPIMFYGLGGSSPDLPHTIIIENRDHGRTLSIDAIQVQD